MKKFILIFTLLIAVLVTNGQDYKTGLGFRLGGINTGISVKHFTGSTTALEGIVGFARHSFVVTGLYEKHQSFPNAAGLKWFYGIGGHAGFFTGDYTYGYYYYYKYKGNKVIGVTDNTYTSTLYIGGDVILGIEYKFPKTPITLGLDVKPQIDIVPGFYGYFDGAFTFRFTL